MMIATTMLRWTMVAGGLDQVVRGKPDAESGGFWVARKPVNWEVGQRRMVLSGAGVRGRPSQGTEAR